MNFHGVVIIFAILSGIFWLPAVLATRKFFVPGTHRPQIHHWYIGFALAMFPWWPLEIAGVLMCVDDSIQHIKQETDPTFETPVHRFYNWVYLRMPKMFQHVLDYV